MSRHAGPWLSALLACTVLSGCLSISTRFVTGLSAEERTRAAALPVYREELPSGVYQLIAPVRGLSCQINQSDNLQASEKGAMEELKRAAFKTGGNAIINVRCESAGRGTGARSCFRSVECHGDAVQVVSAHSN